MLSYEHTNKVSSSMVDGLIYKQGMDLFKQICEEEDPSFQISSQIYYNMLNSVLQEKKLFSLPGSRVALRFISRHRHRGVQNPKLQPNERRGWHGGRIAAALPGYSLEWPHRCTAPNGRRRHRQCAEERPAARPLPRSRLRLRRAPHGVPEHREQRAQREVPRETERTSRLGVACSCNWRRTSWLASTWCAAARCIPSIRCTATIRTTSPSCRSSARAASRSTARRTTRIRRSRRAARTRCGVGV